MAGAVLQTAAAAADRGACLLCRPCCCRPSHPHRSLCPPQRPAPPLPQGWLCRCLGWCCCCCRRPTCPVLAARRQPRGWLPVGCRRLGWALPRVRATQQWWAARLCRPPHPPAAASPLQRVKGQEQDGVTLSPASAGREAGAGQQRSSAPSIPSSMGSLCLCCWHASSAPTASSALSPRNALRSMDEGSSTSPMRTQGNPSYTSPLGSRGRLPALSSTPPLRRRPSAPSVMPLVDRCRPPPPPGAAVAPAEGAGTLEKGPAGSGAPGCSEDPAAAEAPAAAAASWALRRSTFFWWRRPR